MNWLKAAAGDFISELSSDLADVAEAKDPGAQDIEAEQPTASNLGVASGVTYSSAPPPRSTSAQKDAPKILPAKQAAPVSATPLPDDEDLFDWDDSGDEMKAPVKKSPEPVVASSSTQGYPKQALEPVQSQVTKPVVQDVQPKVVEPVLQPKVAEPVVQESASNKVVKAEEEEVPVHLAVVDDCEDVEVLRMELAREREAALRAENQSRKLEERVRTLEAELQAKEKILEDVRAAHASEMEQCDAREAETVARLEQATTMAAEQVSKAGKLLQESKDRERALEARLQGSTGSEASARLSLERELQERDAEIAAMKGLLEKESQQVQKLSAQLKERSAMQRDATPHAAVAATSTEATAALEGFARALAAAQQQVLDQQLRALRSGTVPTSSVEAGWIQASGEWDDDVGWGSDEDEKVS